MRPDVTVVRLGHRQQRDKRITSHLGLTARALGANHFVLCGDDDQGVLDTMTNVTENFGGDFSSEYHGKPMGYLRHFAKQGGRIVHLTMYGEPHDSVTQEIPIDAPIAVVVGGVKVPGEIYKLADHNVAVGQQPHSWGGALGLFMSGLMGGGAGPEKFPDGRFQGQPHPSGKGGTDRGEESE